MLERKPKCGNMGTEHEEINPLTVGQTKWESDL